MRIYFEEEPKRVKRLVNYKVHSETIYDRSKRVHYVRVGCGFDIETSRVETPDIVTGYCYHWQFAMDRYTFMGRSLDSMLDFFKLIESSMSDTKAKLLVLDANLGYEFQYCKRYWSQIGLSNLFAKEKRKPLTFTIGNHIEMREVLGLFGHSLAQISENYTPDIPKLKGDLDYDVFRTSLTPMTEKEIDYCDNDVQILASLGDYIFANYFGNNPTLPMTSTGMIRNKIKRLLGSRLSFKRKEVQSWLPDEKDFNLHRQFLFKGGICGTNAFFMDEILENVVCADFTSDYPACMNHYLYPMGKCEKCSPTEFMTNKFIPYIAVIEFKNVESRTVHSLMSSHKCLNKIEFSPLNCTIDNGRVHSAKSMWLVLNDVEYNSFKLAYDWEEETIYECWRFEKYSRLPAYVLDVLNEEYLIKQELKDKGKTETLDYKDAKASVNGTFGMMCTSLFQDDFSFEDGEIETPKDENGNPIKKSFNEAIKSMFLYPYWGFWITSYARSLLIDAITRFPDLIIQYDTDSLYFIDEGSEELRKYLVDYNEMIYKRNDFIFNKDRHFRDLGAWDIEKPFKRFKGLGSKRYMYEKQDGTIKCVVTGCRKVKAYGKKMSSIQYQLIDNNKKNNTNIDIFDFFKDGMKIDTAHSGKLASAYVDESVIVDYKGETLYCRSAVTLTPIEFNMGVAQSHIDFYMSMKSMYQNCPSSERSGEIMELLEVYDDKKGTNKVH